MFEHLNARAREAAVGFQETLRQAYTAEDRRYIVGRLCETGEALLLALAETPWRPIEEAPKDGTWIMTYCPALSVASYPTVVFWDDGWVPPGNDLSEVEPTHWMPLPAPPDAGGVTK